MVGLAASGPGCGAGSTAAKSDAGSGFPGSGGSGGRVGSGGSGGLPGSGGAAGGSGGSGTGGSGGAIGGSGGAGGAGGGARDGGAASDARPGGDAGPTQPPCAVQVVPLGASSLTQIPAGPGSVLRVRGEIVGFMRPPMPMWRWTVIMYPGGVSAPWTTVDGRADTIQIELRNEGRYEISVSVTDTCSGGATAVAVDPRLSPTSFWIRVTSPADKPAPPKERVMVEIVSGRPPPRTDIALDFGTPVRIDPQRTSGEAIDSYIRVSSPESTVRLEGHSKTGVFMARLSPTLSYDVLVIPDRTTAPALFAGVTAATIGQLSFSLDDGVPVTGRLTRDGGRAVPEARLVLRAGVLPSTLDNADTTGRFDLRARPGSYGAVIVPPPGSGLPEAHIREDAGLTISPPSAGPTTVDFAWRAIATSTLELTVRSPSDGPVGAPVRVRLESVADTLPDVGTLTLNGGAPMTASGLVRAEVVSNAAGVATFPNLPRAPYRAVITPADDLSAITAVTIDLAGATTPSVARTARLLRKVTLSGRLVPATLGVGATVVALDAGIDAAGTSASSAVASDGRYNLALSPGRTYRVFVEPQPVRGLPRVALGTFTAPMADASNGDSRLPTGVPLVGTVTGSDGRPVLGALVQVYCLRASEECLNPALTNADVVRPVSESVTDGDGAYRLVVPGADAPP